MKKEVEMLRNTTETTVDNGAVKNALETAGKVATAIVDLELLKKKVEYAVEDAVVDARRMAKKGRYAVEDVIDDAAYRIKKAPLRSAGYLFGAGLGLGMFTGWMLTRRNGDNRH